MDFKKKISDLKSLDYKELLPRLKDYFANSSKRMKTTSKREKLIIGGLGGFVVLILFFFVVINPKVNEYQMAKSGLERAKAGYNFILNNASKVQLSNRPMVDTATSVKQATDSMVKFVGVNGKFEIISKGDNVASLKIEEAQSFNKITNLIKNLESRYGITIDDLVLTKYGDGVVVVEQMNLIRINREDGIND